MDFLDEVEMGKKLREKGQRKGWPQYTYHVPLVGLEGRGSDAIYVKMCVGPLLMYPRW